MPARQSNCKVNTRSQSYSYRHPRHILTFLRFTSSLDSTCRLSKSRAERTLDDDDMKPSSGEIKCIERRLSEELMCIFILYECCPFIASRGSVVGSSIYACIPISTA